MAAETSTTDRVFSITRMFDAPRQLVWRAWTDPKLMSQWFGPKGVTTDVLRLELHPGGVLHSRMRTPDGNVMWGKFVYREVEEPSRLVWVHSFSDEKGSVTRAPFADTWPLELLTTVVFEEQGRQTKITLTWVPLNATPEERKTFEENMQSMNGGWSGSFDQLDQFLASRGAVRWFCPRRDECVGRAPVDGALALVRAGSRRRVRKTVTARSS
jgi:uncharacterized protein YndB with AHSA1/START domain